jgi:hypothetical protein
MLPETDWVKSKGESTIWKSLRGYDTVTVAIYRLVTMLRRVVQSAVFCELLLLTRSITPYCFATVSTTLTIRSAFVSSTQWLPKAPRIPGLLFKHLALHLTVCEGVTAAAVTSASCRLLRRTNTHNTADALPYHSNNVPPKERQYGFPDGAEPDHLSRHSWSGCARLLWIRCLSFLRRGH